MKLEAHRPKTPPRTGIEARRERQRREARKAILDATQTLLAESEGCDFSIRALAERSGYSAPTVYYHFGDKEGVLTALLEEGLQLLSGQLEQAARERDALVRLRATLLCLIEYVREHPVVATLWGSLMRQPAVAMPPAYAAVAECLDAPLRELIATGRMDGFDKTRAEQILWALLHGLIAIQNAEPDHPWAPGLAEDAVDSLLRGMTTAATRAAAGGSGR